MARGRGGKLKLQAPNFSHPCMGQDTVSLLHNSKILSFEYRRIWMSPLRQKEDLPSFYLFFFQTFKKIRWWHPIVESRFLISLLTQMLISSENTLPTHRNLISYLAEHFLNLPDWERTVIVSMPFSQLPLIPDSHNDGSQEVFLVESTNWFTESHWNTVAPFCLECRKAQLIKIAALPHLSLGETRPPPRIEH